MGLAVNSLKGILNPATYSHKQAKPDVKHKQGVYENK